MLLRNYDKTTHRNLSTATRVRYSCGVQEYANEVPAPKDQPRRPQGSYPVILRLVLSDGSEQWRPGSAIRWTDSGAVMVSWQEQPGDSRSVVHAWLPLADVARVINRPAVR